jgi:putative Mg2+ transporter-C (MgtC) family protein
MTIDIFIYRLGLAFLLGASIGLERQYRQKSAGLRTNTLVSLGSAAFILLSLSLTGDVGDPSRVAGQIVTGIGFLGAGVIMKDGLSVQGLNTAATIWCSAAVGTLAGAGLWIQASATAFSIILVHVILRPIGLLISSLPVQKEMSGVFYYSFKIRCKEEVENHLRIVLLKAVEADEHLQLRSLKSSDNGNPSFVYVEADIFANGKHDTEMEKLAAALTTEYGVTQVSWEVNGQQND